MIVHEPGDHENDEFHEAEEGEWDRVGWKPRFGALPGGFVEDESIQDTQTWLETRLEDKFYGDWYHNAGVIIFACLTTYIGTILGAGLAWVFLVMAICGTYYRTSIRRVRRNYRDDINRELAKTKLETDNETLEWINSFLVKFWPIYAPVVCKTIVGTVDQVLSTSTPPFLDSLRLSMFTLGTKPPRLEHVKTYPKSEDDIVLMDWKFSFTPNDTSDMTARQISVKQNPKVILEVRIGKGIVSKALNVIIEDMACSGMMRVKMKLMLDFPYIEKVEICFLGKPTIDYVCKPIGGDILGFDTNFIPGLSSFILEQIHANLGPMMYEPNVFPIELAKMLAGSPIDQAIGVVQIQFHGGQGLGAPGGGTPDPYVLVTINGRTELARTRTIKQNANPSWNETINIVVTSLQDALDLQVFDYNEYRKDRDLGNATFQLERLQEIEEYENETLEVFSNGKARGIITADIRFFPVLAETKLEDGTVLPPPESLSGIARFTVEQAKDLDGTKSLIGTLNPYAVLLLNGKEVHTSKKLKRTNNPIWDDAHKELLITDRKSAKLGLVIKDDRDLAGDPIIGTYQIKLEDMLELTSKGQEWYNLANVKTGRAKMMLQWKPVALRGALAGGGYITPIGVMRLHFKNARDLKNLETVGKSDPYVRVLVSGVQKGRTVTFKNNLNPDWDEVIYVPVHTTREKLTIECMDEEVSHRDRSLGHFEVPVAEYAHQLESGEWGTNDSKKLITQALTFGKTRVNKGTINYTCSFFPAIPIVDPEEEEREKAELAALEASQSHTNGEARISLDNKSVASTTVPSTRARSNTAGSVKSVRPSTAHVESSVDVAKQLARGAEHQEELLPEKKEPPKIRLTSDDLLNYGGLMYRAGVMDWDGSSKFTKQRGCLPLVFTKISQPF